jgi:hypothetical protein
LLHWQCGRDRAGCITFHIRGFLSYCPVSRQSGTGLKRMPMPDQSGIQNKGTQSGTGLRCHLPECRRHRPRCRCPLLTLTIILWRLIICPYFFLPKLAEAFSALKCLLLTKACWERAPRVAMFVGPATVSSVEVATRLPTAAKIARKKTGHHTRPTAACYLPCK